LRILNNEYNKIINDKIKKLKKEFNNNELKDGKIIDKEECYINKKKKCKKCDSKTQLLEPFSKDILCNECCNNIEKISMTESKKKYKLSEEDLNKIDCLMIYSKMYKKYIRLYKKKDILLLCYIKYNTIKEDEINEKTAKPNKAKEKRINQLKEILKNIDVKHQKEIKLMDIYMEYEKNGKIGIKRLKDIFINLNKYLREVDGEEYKILFKNAKEKIKFYDNNYNEFIKNNNYLKNSLKKYKRKTELKEELKKYNLNLREDSEYCRKYINNEDDLELNFVVNKMREMNWYYTKTNYSKIYGEIRDDYIEKKYKELGWDEDDYFHYIRDRMYEKEYGIKNEEADEEERLERIEISKLTKKEVLKKYKGFIPEYIERNI
jgi:hypothetical protein